MMTEVELNITQDVLDVDLTISQEVLNVTLEIDQSGAPGQGVPTGGNTSDVLTKTSSINYETEWQPKFYDYLVNVKYTGEVTAFNIGKVRKATIMGVDLFRFITDQRTPDGYPVEDSFYSEFDGSSLSGLIVTRG